MIRSNITAKNKNQKGYTLIELIIAVAIVGMLSTGLAAFLIQTIQESERSTDRMQTIMQVENVGFWVSRDVQMSENVTMGLNAGLPLMLEWKDVDQNTYQITYSLIEGQITRSLVKNSQQASSTVIANSINSDPTLTNCIFTNGLLTFKVTATFGNNHISRTYQIKKRLDLL